MENSSYMGTVMSTRPLEKRRVQQALSKKTLSGVILLSVIFPPVLLYYAFCTRSLKQRHLLLTFLVGWYGIAIPVYFDGNYDGADAVRHLYRVHTYYGDLTFDNFLSDLVEIFSLRGAAGANDPYIHVLSYLFGTVLKLPVLFFPTVAIIFGYFFSGSMIIIFQNLDYRKLPLVVVFLGLCLLLTLNFYSFQAVRNPTAMVMLLYGVLAFQNTGRKKYLFLIMLTPMVHFSFLLIAFPALIYLVIGPRPILYSFIFVASFFFEAVNPAIVVDTISQTELGERKIRDRSENGRADISVRSENFGQLTGQGTRGWRAYMMAGYASYAISFFVFSLIVSGLYMNMDRFSQAIFSNGLLMLSAGKFLWFLEGFTGRVSTVGYLLVLGGFIIWRSKYYSNSNSIPFHFVYKYGLYITAFSLFPYFMFYLSIFLDWLVAYYIFFPFLQFIAPEANIPIKDILRAILPI